MDIHFYRLKDDELEDVCTIIAYVPDDTDSGVIEGFIEEHFGEFFYSDTWDADNIDSYLSEKAAESNRDWLFEAAYFTEIFV